MNLLIKQILKKRKSIPRGGGGEPEIDEQVQVFVPYSPRRRG